MNQQDKMFAIGWNQFVHRLCIHIQAECGTDWFEGYVQRSYFNDDYPYIRSAFNDGYRAAFTEWKESQQIPNTIPGVSR